jgi:lysine 2,3-aminomutase
LKVPIQCRLHAAGAEELTLNRVVIGPLEVADDAEPPDGKPVPSLPAIPVAPLKPQLSGLKVVRSRHVVSARSRAFLKRHFPGTSLQEWNDWRWQNRNRVRKLEQLERMVELSEDERDAIHRHQGALPVGATPYYMSLVSPDDPAQGLRRTVLPSGQEYIVSRGENTDPLGEDHSSPVPGLVHRYPDRVLLLATNFCSVYCRYCTRARMVGAAGEGSVRKRDIDRALEYIEQTAVVRDVLISGGDPLSMDEERLDYILGRLRRIQHLEFVRIGSKQPVVQPMRITGEFTRMIRKHQPWMSLHFTHPDELTPEVSEACNRLADAGVPLGSQTVLLKGVNDDVGTMRQLMHGLLKIRVKPYYLYQCDPISGSAHFRTPVEKGLEIIRGLRGHTTGYAVPTFVVDAPNGGGKIPLAPDSIVGRDGDDLLLSNFEDGVFRYPDPGGSLGQAPGQPSKQGVHPC